MFEYDLIIKVSDKDSNIYQSIVTDNHGETSTMLIHTDTSRLLNLVFIYNDEIIKYIIESK